MPQAPDDLIRFTDVMAAYGRSRTWWDARINEGEIVAYTVPGERGLFLSRAAVEQVIAPRPKEIRRAREA